MNKGFMKKRTVKTTRSLFALIFGVVLLSSGCAATPDSSVVRQKGSQSHDNYREADADEANVVETNAGMEAESTKESKDSQDTESRNQRNTENSDSENALAVRLDVPDIYTAAASTSDGSFTLTCDAAVEVPNVTQVPVYSFLTINAADGALIDRSLGY